MRRAAIPLVALPANATRVTQASVPSVNERLALQMLHSVQREGVNATQVLLIRQIQLPGVHRVKPGAAHVLIPMNVRSNQTTAMKTPHAPTIQVGLSVLVMMAIPATVSHAKTMTNVL